MTIMKRTELAAWLAELIRGVHGPLYFCALEIGAAPLEGNPEAFYQLLDLFPGSRIIAFEVDADLCREQNRTARPGLTFFPVALGRTEETRPFYVTAHPMCSSLYRPNTDLIRQYCHMDVSMPVSTTTVETVSLDRFARDAGIADVDFIKIDVQGAELDIFRGGTHALQNALMIVTEVEFIPQYVDQPLFGDVCSFLAEKHLMFQAFLNFGRRSLLPFVVDDPNRGAHFIWSDALFIRNVLQLPALSDKKLLKMAVLATMYGSEDLAYRCLHLFDSRRATTVSRDFLQHLNVGQRQ